MVTKFDKIRKGAGVEEGPSILLGLVFADMVQDDKFFGPVIFPILAVMEGDGMARDNAV